MKIKKTKSKTVVVEFDEFLRHTDLVYDTLPGSKTIIEPSAVIEIMNELSPRRTAYNMWEFNSEEDAHHALFVLGLKQ